MQQTTIPRPAVQSQFMPDAPLTLRSANTANEPAARKALHSFYARFLAFVFGNWYFGTGVVHAHCNITPQTQTQHFTRESILLLIIPAGCAFLCAKKVVTVHSAGPAGRLIFYIEWYFCRCDGTQKEHAVGIVLVGALGGILCWVGRPTGFLGYVYPLK